MVFEIGNIVEKLYNVVCYFSKPSIGIRIKENGTNEI